MLDARLDEETEDEAAVALAGWGGSGGEPPSTTDDSDDSSGGWNDPNTPRDKELGPRRTLDGTAVPYFVLCRHRLSRDGADLEQMHRNFRMVRPPHQTGAGQEGRHDSTDPTAFFTIYVQISLISAIILTMPFLLLQVWRFIEPALTNNERKYTLVLVPFSSFLFFAGAGMAIFWPQRSFSFSCSTNPST